MGGDYQGREPCPARILDDIGGAFAMGAVGGDIWHSVKGFRNAPPGLRNGLFYSADAVKARAPITGGSFATWGALFASFDCLFAWGRYASKARLEKKARVVFSFNAFVLGLLEITDSLAYLCFLFFGQSQRRSLEQHYERCYYRRSSRH